MTMCTCCETNHSAYTKKHREHIDTEMSLIKKSSNTICKNKRINLPLIRLSVCVLACVWEEMRRHGQCVFYLVVFRGGDEEEDGGDGVETLEPAPPLWTLPPHVHHLEGNVLDVKVILVDALGGFTGQQDVLFRGKITLEERQKPQCMNIYTCRR